MVHKGWEIVSIHDANLDRVSDGCGWVFEHTYEELLQYDFGKKFGESFAGLKIITFEEILEKLSCHVIMNVHIKTLDDYVEYSEEYFRKIVALIDKYDCRKYVYFMTGNDGLLRMAKRIAPDICRCCGEHETVIWRKEAPGIVDRAIELGCEKVQLFKPFFTKADIDKAHEHGIICNVFYSDDPEETEKFLEMGVDTVLSNNYCVVADKVKKLLGR